MRLSTSLIYSSSISSYQKGYANIVKTQQQISSGERIQTPADDPVGAARSLQLEQQQALLTQYRGNLTTATNSSAVKRAFSIRSTTYCKRPGIGRRGR